MPVLQLHLPDDYTWRIYCGGGQGQAEYHAGKEGFERGWRHCVTVFGACIHPESYGRCGGQLKPLYGDVEERLVTGGMDSANSSTW